MKGNKKKHEFVICLKVNANNFSKKLRSSKRASTNFKNNSSVFPYFLLVGRRALTKTAKKKNDLALSISLLVFFGKLRT